MQSNMLLKSKGHVIQNAPVAKIKMTKAKGLILLYKRLWKEFG